MSLFHKLSLQFLVFGLCCCVTEHQPTDVSPLPVRACSVIFNLEAGYVCCYSSLRAILRFLCLQKMHLLSKMCKIKLEVKCKLCLSITTSIAKNASNSCIYPDVGLLDAIGKDCCNI